jgi:hypothetical protein
MTDEASKKFQALERQRYRTMAIANPRMATVKEAIVRDATREHMRLRAVPGYRLRGKISTILQHRVMKSQDEADKRLSGVSDRRIEPSTGGALGAVDLSLFDEPQCLKRYGRRDGPVSDFDAMRLAAAVRAVEDTCTAMGLTEIVTSCVTNYVASNQERVMKHLAAVLEARVTAQRAAQAALAGVAGHEHVFPANMEQACRRSIRFPSKELKRSTARITRCVNGGTAFERRPASLTPTALRQAGANDQLQELPQLKSPDGPLRLLPLLHRNVSTLSAQTQQPALPSSAAVLADPVGEAPSGREGGAIQGTPQFAAVAATRMQGLTPAQLRGLRAVDREPTILPVLPLPPLAPAVSTAAASFAASPLGGSTTDLPMPTPNSLASYLRLESVTTMVGRDDDTAMLLSTGNSSPVVTKSPLLPTYSASGLTGTLNRGVTFTEDPVVERLPPPREQQQPQEDVFRFAFDAAAIAGLLNNDGALLHAVVGVLDQKLGQLGRVPAGDGVEDAIAEARAPSTAVGPRVDSGVRHRVGPQQPIVPVDSPVPLLDMAEIHALHAALEHGGDGEGARSNSPDNTPKAHVVGIQRTMSISPTRNSFATLQPHHRSPRRRRADADRAQQQQLPPLLANTAPPGIVGQVLNHVGSSAIRTMLTLWADGPTSAATLAKLAPVSSAPLSDFEPHCIICQAAKAQQDHRSGGGGGSRSSSRDKDVVQYVDEDAKRRMWKALQTTAYMKAHGSLSEALAVRDAARRHVTVSTTHVSGIVASAMARGEQWGLCRGDPPDPEELRRALSGEAAMEANGSFDMRSLSAPPELAAYGSITVNDREHVDMRLVSSGNNFAQTPMPGEKQRAIDHRSRTPAVTSDPRPHDGQTEIAATRGLWGRPSHDMDTEALRVAKCELFWNRFLVFCRSTGVPCDP